MGELVGDDRGIPAFDSLGTQARDTGRGLGQGTPGRFGEDRLAGSGELLEALGQVHGVADHGVLDRKSVV